MKKTKQRLSYAKTLRLYIRLTKPHHKYGLFSLISAPIGELLTRWFPPLIIASMIDDVQANRLQDVSDILPRLALYVGLQLAGEVIFWRVTIWSLNRFDGRSMRTLAEHAFDNLVEKSMHFHNNSFAGSLVAKVNRFVNGFEPFFDTIVFEVSTTLTTTIFTAIILWNRSPGAVWAFLLLAVLFTTAIFPLVRRQAGYNRATAAADSEQTAQLADSLSNIITIKSFSREDYERERYSKTRANVLKKQISSWDFQNIPIDLVTSTTVIGINGVALLAAMIAAINDGQNAGTIFLVVNYISNLTGRLWNFRRIVRRIEQVLSDAAEMSEILDTPNGVVDGSETLSVEQPKGEVSFNNVHFHYAGRQKQSLLTDFNLHIEPGQKIGLVGPSGGGKTTITKLILRFMDIQKGTIAIDGAAINKIKQADLRSMIAYVPQEPLLFHRSLAENIAYGNLKATKKEIIAAAKKAHADEFISQMPNGYETLVGERGVKLSGGQRQRVAIARAILKNAPILILDEATSALDSESEQLVQEALWALMEGRTAIVIAHRLSTIQKMDRIIVLQDGQIVESGSHQELQKQNGLYARLWNHQSGGFIEE